MPAASTSHSTWSARPYFEATLDALNTGGRIVYIAALGGGVLQVPVGP